jgi:hypothetical protein
MEPCHEMTTTAEGYLSEEPGAVTPHAGICGNESQQWLIYPTAVTTREREFERRGRVIRHDRGVNQQWDERRE